MKRWRYEVPDLNPCFFHGEIIAWKFRQKLVRTHGKYAIRFSVTFADGFTKSNERGGFQTQQEGALAKEQIIVDLNRHAFVCFSVTVKEYFDYWLHHYMVNEKQITYNTFMTYRNMTYNYVVPQFGSRKMESISRSDLVNFLNTLESEHMLSVAYGVLGSAFRHAQNINIIKTNIAPAAIKTKRRLELKKQACQPVRKKERKTLDAKTLIALLIICKETEPDFYLPLLLAVVTGCRISELIAMRFSFVNFDACTIYIKDQLGRQLNNDAEKGMQGKQHIKTKSHNGQRVCALPNFVMEEIIIAMQRYQFEKRAEGFYDKGYIWHLPDGRPCGRGAYQAPFNRLKEKVGIASDFHWHDLRHTFATLMAANNVSLKEISTAMGHYDPSLTWKIYIEKEKVISNDIPEINSLIDDLLLPEETGICDLVITDELIRELVVA